MMNQKMVILEGGGHTVRTQYYHGFRPWVEQNLIKLWITDVKDVDARNVTYRPFAFRTDAEVMALDKNPVPKTFFLYKGDDVPRKPEHLRDKKFWYSLVADEVFVVPPDKYHCETAAKWLHTAKRIIVDKAFAPSVEHIDWLCDQAPVVRNKVVGFDHYRMKALPLKMHLNELVSQIGGLKEIEFRMLESRGTEHFKDLPGMLQDLASHLFALIELIGDVDSVQIEKVGSGRYPKAFLRWGDETFGAIKFVFRTKLSDNLVGGSCFVGKGIGYSDDKFLELKGPENLKARLDLRGASKGGRGDIVIYYRDVPLRHVACGFVDAHAELANLVISDANNVEDCFFNIETARQIVEKIGETYKKADSPKFEFNEQQAWRSTENIQLYNRGDNLDTILRKIGFQIE